MKPLNETLAAPSVRPTPSVPSLPTYVVEVAPKLGVGDSPGQSVLAQLPALGITGAREVRVTALYEISGKLSASQVQLIGKGLLCDPITQDFRTDSSASTTAFLIGPHWRVEVWLKPQVTDPVGESVRKAVVDLGLPEPARVRTGVAYQILGRVHPGQMERIVNKLLANPLIHRTKVEQL